MTPRLPSPRVPFADRDEAFEVGRVWCVGRNYAEHAREMGADPARSAPLFFGKPTSAVLAAGAGGRVTVPYPPRTTSLHHEVELAVALGAGGFALDPEAAARCVCGWGVALDLTRRDVQQVAKQAGKPWALAKGFDGSAPVGRLVTGAPPPDARIRLQVGDVLRQDGRLAAMIWSVGALLAELSCEVALLPGDLVLTGTPAGVGALQVGDEALAVIDGAPALRLRVSPPRDAQAARAASPGQTSRKLEKT